MLIKEYRIEEKVDDIVIRGLKKMEQDPWEDRKEYNTEYVWKNWSLTERDICSILAGRQKKMGVAVGWFVDIGLKDEGVPI